MQSIETVLKIYEERGKEGKTLERVYEQLYKPELYAEAYAQIYANRGATTRGNSEETMDGMSQKRWETIIQRLRDRTHHWTAPRYEHIPKANGGTRRLGIPSGDDKLLQAAIKILLEAYYEPQFSERSHGFRPGRGCHTALTEVRQKHKASSWFVEGDISRCFDSINHKILLEILSERIKDNRFLRLIGKLLKSGQMEDWQDGDNPSGTPQGGIVSPLLANIYMDVFDKWIETELLPRYNRTAMKRGGRRSNPPYVKLQRQQRKAKANGDKEQLSQIRKMMKTMPSKDPTDEGYRRLHYIRYADDFLLSFAGPKSEAKEIKGMIKAFLKDRLDLELSDEKTLITHARTQKARFLGYDLKVTHSEEVKNANGVIWMGVPPEAISNAIKGYMKNGKPTHLPAMLNDSDYHIVAGYQTRYRGLVQYYKMAHNIRNLRKVNWVMQTSMLRTLASKHNSTATKMSDKLKVKMEKDGKIYEVHQVVVSRDEIGKEPLKTHYGAIPLERDPVPAKIVDRGSWIFISPRSETLWRLLAEHCEMCGCNEPLEAHHVRSLKGIKKGKTAWEIRMIALNRKTLMICWQCHKAVTYSAHRKEWDVFKHKTRKESRVR